MQKFSELGLPESLLENLAAIGYETPTPIQGQAIPPLMTGKDLLGIAQTGTGKTAAFSLPILNFLVNDYKETVPKFPRVLILAPTRELASQINDNIQAYAKGLKIGSAVIFGGVGQAAQVSRLRQGLHILVATPGRLLDLMNQGFVGLEKIEVFVLDEADRMLDMGFIHDIKKVIKVLPEKRQTLLFSATMPTEIAGLANKLLRSPVKVEVTPASTTVERIDQRVIFVSKKGKFQLLRKLLTEDDHHLTLVFSRTKHGANKIVDYLARFGIKSAAIHGNKSQGARERALEDFKSGAIKVLVATDIAARGIDVDGISHVINYDLPMEPESYVHRIGRTARAGKDGKAISFCDESERDLLSRIQRLIKLKLPVEEFVGEEDKTASEVVNQRRERDPRDPRAKKPRAAAPKKAAAPKAQAPKQEPVQQKAAPAPAPKPASPQYDDEFEDEVFDRQPSLEDQFKQIDGRAPTGRRPRPHFNRGNGGGGGNRHGGGGQNRNGQGGGGKKVGFKFRKRR